MLSLSAKKSVLIVCNLYILSIGEAEIQNIHTYTQTHNQPSSGISNKTLLMITKIQIIRTPNKNKKRLRVNMGDNFLKPRVVTLKEPFILSKRSLHLFHINRALPRETSAKNINKLYVGC